MKTDPWYLLANSYQTIPQVRLWKMVVRQILSWEAYSCILFQRAARGSRRFSNMANNLTEVMYINSMGGLTCCWRIRDNEWCIVNYLRYLRYVNLITVKLGTSLNFILNTFSNKTYSLQSGQDSQAIQLNKHVTARSYGLNQLDGTMTDLQNIHWVYIL